jgi:(2R)-3-sulfolactate dehydrogenase (NADP+)
MRLEIADLQRQVAQFFGGLGLSELHAEQFAEVLIEAEIEGNPGHGLSRIPIYARQLRAGGLNPRPALRLSHTRPGTLILDADGAPGPVALHFGMEALAPLAREQGVASLAVRAAGHVGVLSFYVKRLAQQGYVAMAAANTPPAIAPGPVLGTNPLALAAPTGGDPVVIDSSMSVVARGKVLEAQRQGLRLQPGWAVDAQGEPTEDPQRALAGALLPIGAGKGLALALLVEILAGALAGTLLSPDLPLPWVDPSRAAGPGLWLLAIDPAAHGDPTGFAARMQRLAGALTSSGGRLPGERRRQLAEQARRSGKEIGDSLAASLREVGLELQGAAP